MGLLDGVFGPQQAPDPYADDESTGLFGLFNQDQSYQLTKLSQILSSLAYGRPIDTLGSDVQHQALMEARRKRTRTRKFAKSYSDKLRAAGNNEFADMIDANPDIMDNIMGKKVDYMLDPQKQFYAQIFGDPFGGDKAPGGGVSPETAAKVQKIVGLDDMTPDEILQVMAAGPDGMSGAISNIRTNRRLQSEADARVAEETAKKESVRAFIDEVRKTDPALAKMYEAYPDKAVVAKEKLDEELRSPEFQAYNQMFPEEFNLYAPTDEDRSRIAAYTGIADITDTQIASIAVGGWEQLDERIEKLKDNIRADETALRQQTKDDLEQQAKDELLLSVKPFIDSLRAGGEEELAAMLEKNPAKAAEYKIKLEEQGADPEFQLYSKMFKDVDPDNMTPEQLETARTITGIPTLTREQAASLQSGGWKDIGENIRATKGEISAAGKAVTEEERHAAEQKQQFTENQRLGAEKLQDDYDKAAKGYNEVVKVGRRTQAILAKKDIGPAQQLQVIYDFITALDDNSSVKEGEVGLAQNVASYVDLIQVYKDRIAKGAITSQDAARELGAQVMELARQAEQDSYRTRKRFESLAESRGIPREMVFGPDDIDMSGFKTEFDEETDTGTGDLRIIKRH